MAQYIDEMSDTHYMEHYNLSHQIDVVAANVKYLELILLFIWRCTSIRLTGFHYMKTIWKQYENINMKIHLWKFKYLESVIMNSKLLKFILLMLHTHIYWQDSTLGKTWKHKYMKLHLWKFKFLESFLL